MFILKKIATLMLLPPGIFILFLLVSAVWCMVKRQWKTGLIQIVIVILMWLLAIPPVAAFLLKGLESKFTIPSNPQGDVIVLLGGGVSEGAPDFTGHGTPGEETYGRLVTAVRLQKKLRIPVIVSAGHVYASRQPEAPILKRFLVDLGVPECDVIVEARSRDTIENAKYTKQICEKNGFKKPLLVTSASHMQRAVISFNDVGITVLPFPTNFKTWEPAKYLWVDYLPQDYRNMKICLREYLGLLFYRLAY